MDAREPAFKRQKTDQTSIVESAEDDFDIIISDKFLDAKSPHFLSVQNLIDA